MKKFLFGIVIVTLFALSYVHQEVELLKTGYQLRNREKLQAELLDQKDILTYNILALKAPSRLESALSFKGADYRMPERWEVVTLKSEGRVVSAPIKGRGFLAELFSLKREAEAKTIK